MYDERLHIVGQFVVIITGENVLVFDSGLEGYIMSLA